MRINTHHTPESIEKNRKAHLGKIPYNKGKKGPKQSEATKLKRSNSLTKFYETHPGPWLGKKFPFATRKLLSEMRQGKGNSFYGKSHTAKTIEKLSKDKKILWANPEYAQSMFSKFRKKPTDSELYIDAILQLHFPNHFKYVGDFNKWVGLNNPDFIDEKGKLIIEYDGYYTHRLPEGIKQDLKRNSNYIKNGYKVLILGKLGRGDLKKEQNLIDKINKFISSN